MVQAAGGAEGDSTPSEKTVQKKNEQVPGSACCAKLCSHMLDTVGSCWISDDLCMSFRVLFWLHVVAA